MRSYVLQGAQPGALWWARVVGLGDGREAQKGGNICILMAYSGWGLTENDKIL